MGRFWICILDCHASPRSSSTRKTNLALRGSDFRRHRFQPAYSSRVIQSCARPGVGIRSLGHGSSNVCEQELSNGSPIPHFSSSDFVSGPSDNLLLLDMSSLNLHLSYHPIVVALHTWPRRHTYHIPSFIHRASRRSSKPNAVSPH
ncbi:hypothetical protein GALMADRAFT_1140083 [Galerina marginata CBS 339.88]|uniref:Uncharacterized protein n=1 Tax=Galerina marginata (strain CBS 339.88) TaxID=685588 RepID=A0A067S7C4_GALM3|nr:hypothetical protein GALMADRAFT_1140083 [Galerina marginata CBS 339.88]